MRFFTYHPASLYFIFIRCCYNSENEVDEIKPSEKNNTYEIQHRPRTHGVDDLKKKKYKARLGQFSLKWKLSVLALSGRLSLRGGAPIWLFTPSSWPKLCFNPVILFAKLCSPETRNRTAWRLVSRAGVFRGARGEGWKTSSPKNACVGDYLEMRLIFQLVTSHLRGLNSDFSFLYSRPRLEPRAHYRVQSTCNSTDEEPGPKLLETKTRHFYLYLTF